MGKAPAATPSSERQYADQMGVKYDKSKGMQMSN
jgi:hypothetical protein